MRNTRERWQAWIWWAALTAIVLLFFLPSAWRGHTLVPNDLLHEMLLPFSSPDKPIHVQNHYAIDALTATFPNGLFWQQCMQAGQWPVWNPYIFGGHPYLAASAEAALCPFRFLYLCLSAERAYTWIIICQFLLAAWGMFALVRGLGRSWAAATVAGCAWGLNSALLQFNWAGPATFCWAPWIVLFAERGLRYNSWRYALLAGATLGVAFVSGSIQAAFHIGFLSAGYFLFRIPWTDPVQRTTALRVAVLMFGVAGLVALAQWLPTLELLSVGGERQMIRVRPGANASLRHTALALPALMTFLFPGLVGSPQTFDLLKVLPANMMDFTGYIGLVPWALALVAVATVRERPVRAIGWTALVVVGIVLFTPLLRFVYHRFFIVVTFAAAMLAGYGTDVLLDTAPEQRTPVRRVLLSLVGVGILVLLGLVVIQTLVYWQRDALVARAQQFVMERTEAHWLSSRPDYLMGRVPKFLDHFRLTNPVFWVPLLTLALLLLLWRVPQRQPDLRWLAGGALVALTVLDLFTVGRGWVVQASRERYPLFPKLEALVPVQQDPELCRVLQWSPDNSLLLPNSLLMGYQLSTIHGNVSLVPRSLIEFPIYTNGQFTALLDLQNIKYLLTQESMRLPTDRFEPVIQANGLRLYRNRSCLPRAFFVGCWEVEADQARTLSRMAEPEFDPRALVFVNQPPSLSWAMSPDKAAGAAEVRVVKYEPTRVTITVSNTAPGLVVLSDTFYPGWKATVDGRAAPVLRADYALRAVAVDAGAHIIEYHFVAGTVRWGAAISLSTLTVVALGLASAGLGYVRKMKGNES